MLFQGKQLLSGSWLLDGFTLFFILATLYQWTRWLVVHLLYITSWGYEKVQTEVWDHNGVRARDRKNTLAITFLMLCFELAAYLIR